MKSWENRRNFKRDREKASHNESNVWVVKDLEIFIEICRIFWRISALNNLTIIWANKQSLVAEIFDSIDGCN